MPLLLVIDGDNLNPLRQQKKKKELSSFRNILLVVDLGNTKDLWGPLRLDKIVRDLEYLISRMDHRDTLTFKIYSQTYRGKAKEFLNNYAVNLWHFLHGFHQFRHVVLADTEIFEKEPSSTPSSTQWSGQKVHSTIMPEQWNPNQYVLEHMARKMPKRLGPGSWWEQAVADEGRRDWSIIHRM